MDDPVSILLVEDNLGDARLLREVLAEVGTAQFELVYVDRLDAALSRLAVGGVDVILLDLSLPDGYGLDTVKRVYTAAPDVPTPVDGRTARHPRTSRREPSGRCSRCPRRS